MAGHAENPRRSKPAPEPRQYALPHTPAQIAGYAKARETRRRHKVLCSIVKPCYAMMERGASIPEMTAALAPAGADTELVSEVVANLRTAMLVRRARILRREG